MIDTNNGPDNTEMVCTISFYIFKKEGEKEKYLGNFSIIKEEDFFEGTIWSVIDKENLKIYGNEKKLVMDTLENHPYSLGLCWIY